MTKSSVPRTEPWGDQGQSLGAMLKRAKPTEMPFEMWTCVGPMNHVLRWGPGPLEERAIFFPGGACPSPLRSIGNILREPKLFSRWQLRYGRLLSVLQQLVF